MKKCCRLLAYLTLAMSVSVAVIVILNEYNPLMGFLTGAPAKVYLYLLCALAAAEAFCLLYFSAGRRRYHSPPDSSREDIGKK